MSEAVEPRKSANRPLLIIIALLLLLSTAATTTQLVMTFQQNSITATRAATYQARVKEAEALVSRQQTIIFGLIEDYHAAAYEDPSVERIAEQQLLVAESTLAALQIIAIQNSQVIELLAAAP
jgi:flagellar basal body-associated protein FliL